MSANLLALSLIHLCLAAPPQSAYGSMAWSPDGRWLAFVTQASSTEPVSGPSWWTNRQTATTPELKAPDLLRKHTLWLCQAETGFCWRLATNDGAISAPAWSRSGQQLAYLRVHAASGGLARIELLLQTGFDRPKVLTVREQSLGAEKTSGTAAGAAEFFAAAARTGPVWSPRDRFLAVPWFDPPGTAIVRVSDGNVEKTYAGARLPAWSPDERRLLLVMAGEEAGYHLTLADFGTTRLTIAETSALQAACWDAAGQAFHVVAWRDQATNGGLRLRSADLFRYDVAAEKQEFLRHLLTIRPDAAGPLPRLYFAPVPGTTRLLVMTTRESEMTDILDVDITGKAAPARYWLPHRELLAGAPSVSKDKHSVALRYGSAQRLGVPAVFDLRNSELRTILPDRDTQLDAVQSVIELILQQLETAPPPDDGKPPRHIVRLPSPGDLNRLGFRDARVVERIEHLARFGSDLLKTEISTELVGHERRRDAEVRMFVCYMLGQYRAALAAVEELEPLVESGEDRLALSVVRAQCYIGERKWTEARELLSLLSQRAGRAEPQDAPAAGSNRQLLRSAVARLLDEIANAEK